MFVFTSLGPPPGAAVAACDNVVEVEAFVRLHRPAAQRAQPSDAPARRCRPSATTRQLRQSSRGETVRLPLIAGQTSTNSSSKFKFGQGDFSVRLLTHRGSSRISPCRFAIQTPTSFPLRTAAASSGRSIRRVDRSPIPANAPPETRKPRLTDLRLRLVADTCRPSSSIFNHAEIALPCRLVAQDLR